MTAASVFEFMFPAEAAAEGIALAQAIGGDMPATVGYLGHDVIQDLADPGHVVVVTRWAERTQGETVLGGYVHDPKVARAGELLGVPPRGFLGAVLSA